MMKKTLIKEAIKLTLYREIGERNSVQSPPCQVQLLKGLHNIIKTGRFTAGTNIRHTARAKEKQLFHFVMIYISPCQALSPSHTTTLVQYYNNERSFLLFMALSKHTDLYSYLPFPFSPLSSSFINGGQPPWSNSKACAQPAHSQNVPAA